jgi:hypothetical protein
MYNIVQHEQNIVEVDVSVAITRKEFKDVCDTIKDYSDHVSNGKIIFNTCKMKDTYILKVFLEDFGFYENFKDRVDRIAFVSSGDKERFMIQEFSTKSDLEIKTFERTEKKRAYAWLSSGNPAQYITEVQS